MDGYFGLKYRPSVYKEREADRVGMDRGQCICATTTAYRVAASILPFDFGGEAGWSSIGRSM